MWHLIHSCPMLAQEFPLIHFLLHLGHLYSPKHLFFPWYGVRPSPFGRAWIEIYSRSNLLALCASMTQMLKKNQNIAEWGQIGQVIPVELIISTGSAPAEPALPPPADCPNHAHLHTKRTHLIHPFEIWGMWCCHGHVSHVWAVCIGLVYSWTVEAQCD